MTVVAGQALLANPLASSNERSWSKGCGMLRGLGWTRIAADSEHVHIL